MTDKTEKAAVKAGPAPFNLAALDTVSASDAGARIAIVHPVTKEPLGIFITVLGKHSETFRELVRERANEGMKKASEKARRGKQMPVKTAEELERDALELLAACTVGWDSEAYEYNDKGEVVNTTKYDYLALGDEHYTFNANNAKLIYSKFPVIKDQVDDAIGDLENFIPA